jgi:hypothetical protein
MEELFSYGISGFRKFLKRNIRPLLYTIIVHLLILIAMIFIRVDQLKDAIELGIQLEFEEKTVEDIIEEEEMEVPADWLEQLLAQREASSNRAVNVNAEDAFSTDISTKEYVQNLLDQIDEARREEDRERLEELQSILASSDYEPPAADGYEEEKEYSGPTTITYEFLEEPLTRGRIELVVPVYRCQGSGRVRVEVVVSRDGRVLSAEVKGPIEGNDRVCFSDAALEAARSSRFRSAGSAPDRHRAIITYTFVAQ